MLNSLDTKAFQLMKDEDEKLRKKGKPLLYEEYTAESPVFYLSTPVSI